MDRATRLSLALDRQDGRCLWCGREFGRLITPTTDHLVPRLKGGPSITANEVAACRRCNADRGHVAPVEWLQECGRQPDRSPQTELLVALLVELDTELARSGGSRRARKYLTGQLRRIRRIMP
ncbi:HNH endonuclease [Rhodococcus pyridinivorans]